MSRLSPSTESSDCGYPSGLGLLLVGHGTRDPAGLAEFRQLHQRLVERAGDLPVAACFLELAEPTIIEGLKALLDQGARQIIVAPLLLFAAGHAKRDIPEGVNAALQQLKGSHAAAVGVRILGHLPPLACHEKLLALSQLRYSQAQPIELTGEREPAAGMAKSAGSLPADSLPATKTLVLVGRGSSDAEATSEMQRFAQLRRDQLPGVTVEVCFYALAEPRLEPTLARVANSPATQVIVQPHVLFSGEVRGGIALLAQRYAALTADRQQWLLCDPLGPHELLAAAMWDLFDPWFKQSVAAEIFGHG